MMKRRASWICLVTMVLMVTLATPVAASRPWSDYGSVLTEEEMAGTEGELGQIVSGAIIGAVSGAFSYATGSDDHSLSGLAKATAIGAAWGAVSGACATVNALATGGSLAVKAAETAWGCFVGANVGALKGAVEQIQRHLGY